MAQSIPNAEIKRLLRERAWLRRLALSLVNDQTTAEDLAQDVYLVALERAPAGIRHPRAWLATVLRRLASNRARSNARRRRHEAAWVRNGQEPATVEVVARAELVEQLAQLVLKLPDPYRFTVLLRYFETEPPRRIAERMGVPVETVRTRLRRARATLRERMDRHHGGNRAAWTITLRQWIRMPTTTTAVSGVPHAAIVAVAAAFLVGGLALRLSSQSDSVTPHVVHADQQRELKSATTPVLHGLATQHPATLSLPEAYDALFDTRRKRIVVKGRVVHANGSPAADATVKAWCIQRHVEPTQTDANGRYRLELGAPPRTLGQALAIHAIARDGTAGTIDQKLWVGSPPSITAKPIVLRRARTLRVRVVKQGSPVPYARVVLSSLIFSTWTPRCERIADANGDARFVGLAKPGWRIDASSPDGGRGTAICAVPIDPDERVKVDVHSANRSLRVRVLDQETKEPIAGAVIEVLERRKGYVKGTATHYAPAPHIPPTDDDGRTAIHHLDPRASIALVAHVRGRAPSAAPNPTYIDYFKIDSAPAIPMDARDVVLHVPTPKEVNWPVSGAGGGVVPPDGTPITLHSRSVFGSAHLLAPIDIRMRDGRLCCTLPLLPSQPYVGVARTSNGQIATVTLPVGTTEGPDVTFFAAGEVRVVLHYADGHPACGARVQLNGRVVNTNDDGEAQFGDLPDGTYAALLVPTHATKMDEWEQQNILGTVTLTQGGEGRIEATVARARDVHLTLKREGEPFLPPGLSLAIDNTELTQYERTQDPGTVRFSVRPDALTNVARFLVSSPNMGSRQVELHAEDGHQALHHELEIEPAAPVRIRVRPPADKRFRVELQRWDTDRKQWRREGWNPLHPWPQHYLLPEVLEWQGVRAGRCRVVDQDSGVHTREFQFDPAHPPDEVILDLQDVIEIEGSVEVPNGHDVKKTFLGVQGRAPRALPFGQKGGLEVADDGSFTLRCKRGAKFALVVEHPALLLAEGGTRMEVRADETPKLRLVAGAQAWFTLHPATRPGADSRNRHAPLHLHVWRHGNTDETPRSYFFRPVSSVVRFGGLTPGRYDVLIDLAPWAPLRLDGVKLEGAISDLGKVRLPVGASIEVTLVMLKETRTFPVELLSKSLASPSTVRSVRCDPGEPVILQGLSIGQHNLMLCRTDTNEKLAEWVVNVEANKQVLTRMVELK